MATERQRWDDVYDQIHIAARHPAHIPLPLVTDAELDEAEARLGSRLPLSYRAFMKRFGPGFLEYSVRLDPIAFRKSRIVENGIIEKTLEQRVRFSNYEGYPDWLGRAVFFGDNGGGDSFVWDPESMSESGAQDCPIYEVRHWENEPQREADSFLEFIQNALAAIRAWREEKPQQSRAPANQFAFERLLLRIKERAKRADVLRWLAFNHNTVRDLSLAIRDHGRADAFPLLADALEEAGCTNPDVLDSCRCGDPDIDGVWVLRVLLGER